MFTPEERRAHAAAIQEKLEELDGARWSLCAYGTTHPSFVFIVERDGGNEVGSWTLSCIMPKHFCGPLVGMDCRFRVSLEERAERSFLVLSEERSGLTVHSLNVHVTRRQ